MLDLSPEELQIVTAILRRVVPDREVWAFGSRITETARKYSDLDLTVITDQPLDFKVLGDPRDSFSISDLPFKVDIIDWSSTSAEFQAIIKRNYKVIAPGDKQRRKQ